MSEHQEPYPVQSSPTNDHVVDEISLIDLAIILAKHKKLILGLPLVVAIIAAVVTLFIPNTYKATTKILPVASSSSKDAIISLFRSQAMADSLVNLFKLQVVYGTKTPAEARNRLVRESTVNAGTGGTVDISVIDHNPRQAANIANAYIRFSRNLLHKYGLTDISRRRLLLQKQQPDMSAAISRAEQDLIQSRLQLGHAVPEAEVTALIKASSELKAKIAMTEIELFIADNDALKNATYLKNLQELNSLWNDFANIDKDPAINARIADKDLDYLHKLGNLEYAQARYDQLMKQIEKAEFDEIRENPTLQVLDKADIPQTRFRPQRAKIVIVSVLASIFFSVLIAFATEAVNKMKESKESNVKYKILLNYLRWK